MTSLVNPKTCCFYLHHRTGMGQGAKDSFLFVDQALPFPELWGFGVICKFGVIIYYVYSQICANCPVCW